MSFEFTILNLAEAKFECTFGRGCEGICCREGRPPMYAEEIEQIEAHLEKFLPLMRPEAQAVARRDGFLEPRRRKIGQRVMRLSRGWCIFFNQGCVLHQVGAEEGDAFRYKPSLCSLFPLQQDGHNLWYVRQKGYKGEIWDLPCLNPQATAIPAAESLREEIELARQFDDLQRHPQPEPSAQASGANE